MTEINRYPRSLTDQDIEKLMVAKGYLDDIVGYTLNAKGRFVPLRETVTDDVRANALLIVQSYYQGLPIRDLPLIYYAMP